MNTVKNCLLPVLLTALATSASHGQETLELYTSPDIYSEKVETVTVDDPRLGEASPVLDEAKAALGWQFADFNGPVVGYVPDAKIGKDLLPVDNSLVRAEPSDSSPVLCVYQFGDPIEILDTGLWWEVRVETTFPVYFVADAPPPLPPVTGEAVEPEEDVPAALAAVEEDPVVEPPTSLVPAPPPVQAEAQRPRPGVVGQRHDGILREAKRRFGLLKPKEDYYLEGPDGKRLAWVKLEGAVISGSINDYFDQPVIIHGERIQMENSRQFVIYARNLRPRN